MRKLLVILTLAVALLLAPTAQAQDPVEIDFLTYLTGPDGAYYADLVTQFNEEQSDIHVNFLVEEGGADYNARLTLGIRSGNAPAVAMLEIDKLPRFVESDFITSFSVEEFEEIFHSDFDDFVPSTISGAMANDRIYAVPLAGFHAAMYYNVDHFEAAGIDGPPETWAEFVEYAQMLTQDTDGDGATDQWGYYCFGGWQYRVLWQWYSVLWGMGGELLNEDLTEVAFDSEEGVAALQFFVDLIREHEVCPAEPADGEQAFGSGQLSMHLNGPWMISFFDSLPELNWQVANLPTWDGNAAAWGSVHTMTFPMNVPDEQHQAGLVFGAWLADHTADLAAAGAYAPRYSVLESEAHQALEAQTIFGQGASDYLRMVPPVEYWPEAEQILLEYFDGALLGTVSAEEAVMGAAEEIQYLVEEYAD